jgi:2,3,4,5-tetrahydropyridine-2-carboxylate N-succinyltransferase
MSLAEKIERLYHQQTTDYGQEFFDTFKELKQGLNSGEIRAAEPAPGELTGWKVNAWVKMGILFGVPRRDARGYVGLRRPRGVYLLR